MRFHRWLLRLYPKSFRNEYGQELTRVFRERRETASGAGAVLGLWISEILDVLANAPRVHADIMRQDLKFSFRALRRTPGFFAAAVIVTALGIGATTAAFTLTDHILLRPLPYPDADRILKIWEASPNRPVGINGIGGTNDVSPANYHDWAVMSSSFDAIGAYTPISGNLTGLGDAERLSGVAIAPGALRAVG